MKKVKLILAIVIGILLILGIIKILNLKNSEKHLQQELAGRVKRIDSLNMEVEKATKLEKVLKDSVNKLNDQRNVLNQTLVVYEEENALFEDSLNTFKKDLKKASSEIRNLLNVNKSANSKISELSNEVLNAEKEIARLENTKSDNLLKIKEFKKQLSEIQDLNKTLQERLDITSNALKRAEKKIYSMKSYTLVIPLSFMSAIEEPSIKEIFNQYKNYYSSPDPRIVSELYSNQKYRSLREFANEKNFLVGDLWTILVEKDFNPVNLSKRSMSKIIKSIYSLSFRTDLKANGLDESTINRIYETLIQIHNL